MDRPRRTRAVEDTPFDNIESAQEYVHLLGEAVDQSLRDSAHDLDACRSDRQRDALRLVTYKLTQLRTHLTASSRILNDLRTLRRLLLNQRTHADDVQGDAPAAAGIARGARAGSVR